MTNTKLGLKHFEGKTKGEQTVRILCGFVCMFLHRPALSEKLAHILCLGDFEKNGLVHKGFCHYEDRRRRGRVVEGAPLLRERTLRVSR
jgi:hypothetical protein